MGIRATKLFHPALNGRWIERQPLLYQLTQSLERECGLTLVSAPAGYGKSTLAGAWLAKMPLPSAWLSLDEMDDDPGRFMLYFIAAIQRVEPAFCTELFAALQAGQLPPVDMLVTILVNEMSAWAERRILVLDDFQYIQNSIILEMLSHLLAQQARPLHLVILTREDPALPLARLRVRGQLTEIRSADLRFSEAEAAQLLRDGLRLELSVEEVARLTERTEGWAAGLQLAGLSLQRRENPGAFVETLSGSHRFILDYLTEEVLKTQPPDVQDFLLKTSILPRLGGDLCNAVTGRTDSANLLERLLAANLFIIPLDDEGRWYRYHHLFAELLQHRLKRQCGDCLLELHQNASRWYEEQDMPTASIEHALGAGDETRTVALLERYAWRLLTHGHSRPLMKWVEALPEARRSSSPKLNTVIVWGKILHGDYQGAIPYLMAAQLALQSLPPGSSEARALQADLLALQSFIVKAQGKIPESLTLAEQARALVPFDDARLNASTALALGTAYRTAGRFSEASETLEEALRAAHAIDDHVTAMVAMAHLSLIWYPLGRLRLLAERAKAVIERAETISRIAPAMSGSVHAVLGQVYYEWNQVEKARETLLHGVRLATLAEQPASVVYGNVHLARLYQGEGDLPAAAECLRAAGEVLAKGGPGWARPDWIAQQASLLVAQGNLAEAESTLRTTRIPAEAPISYQTDAIHLAWLRWMIASRHPGAFALAKRIVQSGEKAAAFSAEGRNGTLIQALVLGAQVGGGAAWLARARQIGEPEGYERIFMDESRGQKPAASPELIEQLTERELEVLRLLAEGLTYAQMAERLVVSVNTVRYHVKGIYGKLGVEKQVQAVERGRELGLLG